MPSDTGFAARLLASYLLVYAIHSTLLIGLVWLVVSIRGVRSPSLTIRLWKLSAVLPLATACLSVIVTYAIWTPAEAKLPDERGVTVAVVELPDDEPSKPDFHPPVPGEVEESEVFRPHDALTQPVTSDRVEEATGDALAKEISEAAMFAEMNVKHERGSTPAIPPTRRVLSGRNGNERLWRFAETLAFAWIVWGAVFVAHFVMQASLIRRRVGGQEVLDRRVIRSLEVILSRNSIRRRPVLLESDRITEPIAFGILRWTIVLPAKCLATAQPADYRAIMAHELGHLVRGDLYWLWFGRCLCGAFLFQPLNQLAYRRWQIESELLADRWAVQGGVSSHRLARCLTAIAEAKLSRKRLITTVSAVGTPSAMMHRVRLLLDDKVQSGDPWSTTGRQLLITAVASTVILTLPGMATVLDLPLPALTRVVASSTDPAEPRANESYPKDASRTDSIVSPSDPTATSADHGWDVIQRDFERLATELEHARRLLQSRAGDDQAISLFDQIHRRSHSIHRDLSELNRNSVTTIR